MLKERGGERPFVATKAGRRLPQQTVAGYTDANLRAWIERSLTNLEVETLDLVQLHCPPTDLYYHPEVFDSLDRLVEEGKIRNYGVSVERIEEAIKAIEYPGRHERPDHLQHLPSAAGRSISSIWRRRRKSPSSPACRWRAACSPESSPQDSTFADDDHRKFNRHGEAFDVGETFSGVPYEVGLKAVERIRKLVGGDATMAQFALRWILMFDAVTVAIPGAKTAAQAQANARAADLPRAVAVRRWRS